MGKRIFSTLLLWAITAITIIYGKSFGWAILIAILSAGTISEVCALLERIGCKPMRKTLQISNILIFTGAMLNVLNGSIIVGGVFAFAICAIAIAISILKDPYGDYPKKTALPTILTLLAVPFTLHWLVLMGTCFANLSAYTGVIIAIWIVATAKFSDVGAYVIGASFGRHKMSPTISPNKTWEGAVGGLISSALMSGIIFGFATEILPKEITLAEAMFAGFVIGAVAIVSDLLESVLKRKADIKDSGKFIPGIGGALDLADSLLLASPTGFILIWIMLSL